MSSAETEATVPTEDQSEPKEEPAVAPAAEAEPEKTETENKVPEEKKESEEKSEEGKETKEIKENGEATSSGEIAAAENALAATEENPAPECDTKPEETPAHVKEAEELFTKLSEDSENSSLLKKYLTKELLDKLKAKKTSLGGTLADCIRSGCDNKDSQLGLYATDAEAYKIFSDLFEPIIKDHHKLPPKKNVSQPALNLGDPKFENLDADGNIVVSTKISVSRSVETYSFSPSISSETRKELETKVVEAFKQFDDGSKGTYHPLSDLSSEIQNELKEGNNFFTEENRYLKSAGALRDWPDGRGVFISEQKNLIIWVNTEDHINITVLDKGGDVNVIYKRLINSLTSLEQNVKPIRDNKLGFLTTCLSNIGTTISASIRVNVPHSVAAGKVEKTVEKLNVDIKDHGDNIYELSNKRRLGLTELQCITELYNGVKEIVRVEKELAWRPENVDDMFDHLSKSKTSKSLLKKHLTKEIFESLKEKKTTKEATLGDCILSGVLNLDSGVGLYAADPESYTEFAALFDPVIKDYHKLKATEAIAQPVVDFGDLENLEFGDLDPEGEMIVSTRIRVGRSHNEFVFPPVLTKEDRLTMEKKSIEALEALDGDLKGTYHPLTGMSKEVQEQMTADHFLFNDSDRFLKAAGGYNDWPEGRGIFFSENKNFLVWVNEEDHLRIISMQKGGDLGAVYKRLVTGIKSMEEKLTFARDERLGYLTFCPTNLGTTLRASVHIKIPHLSAKKDFKAICEKHKLQARGIHGEHTASEGGVYDISNKRRLGLSEIDAVKEMAAGVKEIIRLEKEAAVSKGKNCTVL